MIRTEVPRGRVEPRWLGSLCGPGWGRSEAAGRHAATPSESPWSQHGQGIRSDTIRDRGAFERMLGTIYRTAKSENAPTVYASPLAPCATLRRSEEGRVV